MEWISPNLLDLLVPGGGINPVSTLLWKVEPNS